MSRILCLIEVLSHTLLSRWRLRCLMRRPVKALRLHWYFAKERARKQV